MEQKVFKRYIEIFMDDNDMMIYDLFQKNLGKDQCQDKISYELLVIEIG